MLTVHPPWGGRAKMLTSWRILFVELFLGESQFFNVSSLLSYSGAAPPDTIQTSKNRIQSDRGTHLLRQARRTSSQDPEKIATPPSITPSHLRCSDGSPVVEGSSYLTRMWNAQVYCLI
ncbi:hypothetical protein BJX96DRAFT_103110 [Aspergillus floccosus]